MQIAITVHELQQLIQEHAKSHAASNAKNTASVHATIIISRSVQVIAHLDRVTELDTLAVTGSVAVAVAVTVLVM